MKKVQLQTPEIVTYERAELEQVIVFTGTKSK